MWPTPCHGMFMTVFSSLQTVLVEYKLQSLIRQCIAGNTLIFSPLITESGWQKTITHIISQQQQQFLHLMQIQGCCPFKKSAKMVSLQQAALGALPSCVHSFKTALQIRRPWRMWHPDFLTSCTSISNAPALSLGGFRITGWLRRMHRSEVITQQLSY